MAKIFTLALLTLGWAAAARTEPVAEIPPHRITFVIDGQAVRLPCERSLALEGPNTQAERAALLVPGSNRNAAHAYDNLIAAAAITAVADSTALLLAPQFLSEEDVAFHGLPSDMLFWSDSGWKQGDLSLATLEHPRPVRMSSFAVMDSILHRIAAYNPNLRSLVVAGHSAGGQFVQRYAAGNRLEPLLTSQFGVAVSYVVANPSSYLYLHAERVVPGTTARFETPAAAAQQACPGYDTYKYGLVEPNAYMSGILPSQIVAQYPTRHVTYLLGLLDTDPADPSLDTSCPAGFQGPHRLARGLVYGNYLRHFFGSAVLATHRVEPVPGVGHSSSGMFTSACGAALLFGATSCGAVSGQGPADDPPLPSQSLPNPFRVPATIRYRVPRDGDRMTLRVHDIRGRLVRSLVHGQAGPGFVSWDGLSDGGERVPAGMYIFRLQQNAQVFARKALLLR